MPDILVKEDDDFSFINDLEISHRGFNGLLGWNAPPVSEGSRLLSVGSHQFVPLFSLSSEQGGKYIAVVAYLRSAPWITVYLLRDVLAIVDLAAATTFGLLSHVHDMGGKKTVTRFITSKVMQGKIRMPPIGFFRDICHFSRLYSGLTLVDASDRVAKASVRFISYVAASFVLIESVGTEGEFDAHIRKEAPPSIPVRLQHEEYNMFVQRIIEILGMDKAEDELRRANLWVLRVSLDTRAESQSSLDVEDESPVLRKTKPSLVSVDRTGDDHFPLTLRSGKSMVNMNRAIVLDSIAEGGDADAEDEETSG
jgi:hypothetical protein